MLATVNRPTDDGIQLPVTGRAAIYVRVSSHKQEDGTSLEVQLESCRCYCQANGLEVVAEFQDIQSGLVVDRPAYQQALQLAREGAISHLVVFRYDRSGRDDAEYMTMLRDFAKAGILLASASGESPDPLYQKLAGVLSWDESRRLSIRISGGKMKRHEEGKWNGKAVFGYDLVRLPRGGATLAPNPAQANLVTEMFRRYAAGRCSLMDLQRFLKESGVSRGRYGILYLLRNRTYLGEVPHGKDRRTSQFQAQRETTWTEGQHPALVDQETFDRVQERLDENRSRRRGGPRPQYLFSGLVVCGGCGHKYVGRTTKRVGDRMYVDYRCYRRSAFSDCAAPGVVDGKLREAVIPPLQAMLNRLSQAKVREMVREELAQLQAALQASNRQSKESLGQEKERLEARLSALEDSYLDRDITRDRYLLRRDEINIRLGEISAALIARPHRALPDMAQIIAIAESATIKDLEEPEWRDLIEIVIDRVVIEGQAPATVRVEWKPEFQELLAMVGSQPI
ncbi:MAG: recombinase family protein [Dehalococcoidia bacterium]